jgi:peptide/nickel transport system permease protein
VHRPFLVFVARRAAIAAALVLLVSSAALLLARVAPGDQLTGFDADPAVAAAERHRLGLDRPLVEQYFTWLARTARLDFGESVKYHRPVAALVQERAGNSLLLGVSALIVATLIGIPLGIFTGTRHGGWLASSTRGISIMLLSVPSLITSLALLLAASRTGWFPVGGLPDEAAGFIETLRYLALPVLALALPIVASLERLQSRALAEAMTEPCIVAARARGLSNRRVICRHALPLSLKPVLALYGIIIGSVISGSFAVVYVMSWQGLGLLMYEGLTARDAYLVAGCAAAGSLFLASGIFLADIALAAVDPRTETLS